AEGWGGWAVVAVFVAGGGLGKYAGVIASRTAVGARLPSGFADRRQLVAPLSGLSIALVISVQGAQDAALSWVVTAVIGGAIATELLIRDDGRAAAAVASAAADPADPSADGAPIDELDDGGSGDAGPGYRDQPAVPHGSRSKP